MREKEQAAQKGVHAADAAALGFYYQALFALVTLIAQTTDDAAVVVERLDDVELKVDGNTMLYQLKHSMSETPPPVTLASRALWKTVKVWIDALPALTLSETTLWLVVVGSIPGDCPLKALLETDLDRSELLKAMQEEAKRVIDERTAAKKPARSFPMRSAPRDAKRSSRSAQRNSIICFAGFACNRTVLQLIRLREMSLPI